MEWTKRVHARHQGGVDKPKSSLIMTLPKEIVEAMGIVHGTALEIRHWNGGAHGEGAIDQPVLLITVA